MLVQDCVRSWETKYSNHFKSTSLSFGRLQNVAQACKVSPAIMNLLSALPALSFIACCFMQVSLLVSCVETAVCCRRLMFNLRNLCPLLNATFEVGLQGFGVKQGEWQVG